jgi:hypothetical protein
LDFLNALLVAGDIIIVFGETLLVVGVTALVWARFVEKKRIPAWTLVCLFPVALVIFTANEEPWRSGRQIVSERQFGKLRFAITQDCSGFGDCRTEMWFQDQSGIWRAYGIDGDMTHWRVAGFRNVSSNRVDLTRFGLVIGSFDPIHRQLWLLPGGKPQYAYVEQPVFPYEY